MDLVIQEIIKSSILNGLGYIVHFLPFIKVQSTAVQIDD